MMRRVLVPCVTALAACVLGGCVSKAKADAQARAAFLAGQQAAVQQMQLIGPTVTVVGEVKKAIVPWTADLTLAKAVIAAEYYGEADPTEIIVVRSGEEIRVDPKSVLAGENIPLQPRDLIELRR